MTSTFTSAFWSVELPSSWTVTQEEECATFVTQNLRGILQISSAIKEQGLVTDEDLQEIAKDYVEAGAILIGVKYGLFSGFCLSYATEESFNKEWWLRSGRVMIYVTYNFELTTGGADEEAIDQTEKSEIDQLAEATEEVVIDESENAAIDEFLSTIKTV